MIYGAYENMEQDRPMRVKMRTEADSEIGSTNMLKMWMEPYCFRTRDARLDPWLKLYQPLRYKLLGGNVTALYG